VFPATCEPSLSLAWTVMCVVWLWTTVCDSHWMVLPCFVRENEAGGEGRGSALTAGRSSCERLLRAIVPSCSQVCSLCSALASPPPPGALRAHLGEGFAVCFFQGASVLGIQRLPGPGGAAHRRMVCRATAWVPSVLGTVRGGLLHPAFAGVSRVLICV
jgi:hypothetical protein